MGNATYPDKVMKMHFLLLSLGMYLFPIINTPGNHITFGFCHDYVNEFREISKINLEKSQNCFVYCKRKIVQADAESVVVS